MTFRAHCERLTLSTNAIKSPYIPSQRVLFKNMASEATAKHRPIVMSGPSGAGKSTLLKRLFADYPDRFGFSVSHTTRAPRPGEQDGREYHFVSKDRFAELISQNAFIEHATFNTNNYGTSFGAVSDVAEAGKTCILDIEMEGVKQIKSHPEFSQITRFLFISPPSLETLEQRLRGRATDSDADIKRRLEQARKEMEYANGDGVHDRILVNDNLDTCYAEVKDFCVQ